MSPHATADDYKMRDLLAILVRWRRLAIGAFLAIFVPGVAVTFLMPPVYEASVRLLVNRQTIAPAYSVRVGQTLEPSSLLRSVNRDEEVKTFAETVKTRTIMEPTIAQLELTQSSLNNIRDFRRHVQAAIDFVLDGARWLYAEAKFALRLSKRPTAEETAFLEREDLVRDVAARIKVAPVPDTNVLTASFRSSDPYLAMDTINALVKHFIELQRRTDYSSRNFFARKSEQLEADLRREESELAAYREKVAAYSVRTQRDLVLQTLEKLRADRIQAGATQAAKQAAVETLRAQVQAQPQFQREKSKDLLDAEVELAGYAAQLRAIDVAIAARADELARLNEAEFRTRELERRVQLAEESYKLNQRNLEQARASEGLAQANLSEVQIVDLASFPLSPVRPRTLLFLLIAVGAATLGALAAPFIAHLNDTTLANDWDVARFLDVPFVATLPHVPALERPDRVAVPVPAPAVAAGAPSMRGPGAAAPTPFNRRAG